MKKTKLKFVELKSLYEEIVGNTHQPVGLVNQNLPLITKKRLLDLAEIILPHIRNIEKIQIELIKKYGTKKGEDYNIETTVADKPNPKLTKYLNEFSEFLDGIEEISHTEFSISALDLNTKEVYPVFLTKLCTE